LFGSTQQPSLDLPCDHYAGNPRFAAKAIELQATAHGRFDITLDLEDGAALGNHRALCDEYIDILRSPKNSYRRMGIRLGDLEKSDWKQHTRALISGAGKELAYITLPKIKSTKQIVAFHKFVREQSKKAKLKRIIPLRVLIETPQALAEVNAIAALPQVISLDFGLMDYMSEWQGRIPSYCMKSPWQFSHPLLAHAKIQISSAAAYFGKSASHNVCVDVANPEQAFRDALCAKNEFGFNRMWSIHPDQITAIIAAFTPSQSELNEAALILQQAQAVDWAPIQHAGQLHDRASYRIFWQKICQAKMLGVDMTKTFSS
jgi:citrate lyase subunit beta/citryl-CoA lyase